MDKDLKRAEFLRKLLERYGLKWEAKKTNRDGVYQLVMSFKNQMFGVPGTFICDELEDIVIDNATDLQLNLSDRLVSRFFLYYDYLTFKLRQNKKLYEGLKAVYNDLKLKVVFSKKKLYDADIRQYVNLVDIEAFIQNLILDGVSLDGLPDLEEFL